MNLSEPLDRAECLAGTLRLWLGLARQSLTDEDRERRLSEARITLRAVEDELERTKKEPV